MTRRDISDWRLQALETLSFHPFLTPGKLLLLGGDRGEGGGKGSYPQALWNPYNSTVPAMLFLYQHQTIQHETLHKSTKMCLGSTGDGVPQVFGCIKEQMGQGQSYNTSFLFTLVILSQYIWQQSLLQKMQTLWISVTDMRKRVKGTFCLIILRHYFCNWGDSSHRDKK